MHALNHHFVDEPGGVVGLLKTPPPRRGMHANPNGGSINNIRVSEWRSVDDCVPACLPAKRNVMERKGSPGFSDPPPVAVPVAGPGFYAFCAATRVLSSCSA